MCSEPNDATNDRSYQKDGFKKVDSDSSISSLSSLDEEDKRRERRKLSSLKRQVKKLKPRPSKRKILTDLSQEVQEYLSFGTDFDRSYQDVVKKDESSNMPTSWFDDDKHEEEGKAAERGPMSSRVQPRRVKRKRRNALVMNDVKDSLKNPYLRHLLLDCEASLSIFSDSSSGDSDAEKKQPGKNVEPPTRSA